MAIANSFTGIEVFIAAAKAGSFTAAAARLGVTKSAISKSVTQLESRLGVRLLHRTTRRLTLTPEGSAYFDQVEAAFDQLRSAEDAAKSRTASVSGILRIDMPVAFGRRVAMPVLLDILRDHPNMRLAATFSDKVIDPVEEGVDLCLRFGELPDRSDISARSLGSQRLVLCASPSYLATAGAPQTIAELHRHSCILGSRAYRPAVWRFRNEEGRSEAIEPPDTHILNDGEVVIEMALAGFGLCQMPQSLVSDHIERGDLVEALPDFCRVRTPLNAVWPATRNLLPRVRVVVDELVKRIGTSQFATANPIIERGAGGSGDAS